MVEEVNAQIMITSAPTRDNAAVRRLGTLHPANKCDSLIVGAPL